MHGQSACGELEPTKGESGRIQHTLNTMARAAVLDWIEGDQSRSRDLLRVFLRGHRGWEAGVGVLSDSGILVILYSYSLRMCWLSACGSKRQRNPG